MSLSVFVINGQNSIQYKTPGVHITFIDKELAGNYDLSDYGVTTTSRDLYGLLGFEHLNYGLYGVSELLTGWRIHRKIIEPAGNNLIKTIAQAHQIHPNGMISVWTLGENFPGQAIAQYLLLNSDYSFYGNLYTSIPRVDFDAHGISILNDGSILYAQNVIGYRDYSNLGAPDSLPTLWQNIMRWHPSTNIIDTVFNFYTVPVEVLPQEYTLAELANILPGELVDLTHFNSLSFDTVIIDATAVPVGFAGFRSAGWIAFRLDTYELLFWEGIEQRPLVEAGYPVLHRISEDSTDFRSRLQHYVHQIPRGAYDGKISMFRNGDPAQPKSNVPIFEIDWDNRTIELVKKYDLPVESGFMGFAFFTEDNLIYINAPVAGATPEVLMAMLEENDTLGVLQALDSTHSNLFLLTLEGDTILKAQTSPGTVTYICELQKYYDVPTVIEGLDYYETSRFLDQVIWLNTKGDTLGYDNRITKGPDQDTIYFEYTFVAENQHKGYSKKYVADLTITDVNDTNTNFSSHLYPNPAHNFVTWKGKKGNVNVFDLNGNLIKSTFKERIDITNLIPGTYFLVDEKGQIEQFIKQ
jgi:hypothetical protein